MMEGGYKRELIMVLVGFPPESHDLLGEFSHCLYSQPTLFFPIINTTLIWNLIYKKEISNKKKEEEISII